MVLTSKKEPEGNQREFPEGNPEGNQKETCWKPVGNLLETCWKPAETGRNRRETGGKLEGNRRGAVSALAGNIVNFNMLKVFINIF